MVTIYIYIAILLLVSLCYSAYHFCCIYAISHIYSYNVCIRVRVYLMEDIESFRTSSPLGNVANDAGRTVARWCYVLRLTRIGRYANIEM